MHQSGRWCKKVRGKHHYFGKVSQDPNGQAALDRWLREKDDLLAGRDPRVQEEGLTVRGLCNRFLTAKKHLLDTGELSPRTFHDYHAVCALLVRAFGNRLVVNLAADDFESLRASLARTRGPVALGNEIQRARVVFRYATDAGLIEHPVRYGPTFKRPSQRVLRRARLANGDRMFEAPALRMILGAASQPLRSMILLAVNAGFGNHDVGTLPITALDLDGGWVDFPRPKTAIPRRCSLWPETVAALREALARRPEAKNPDHAGLAFVTKYGTPWAKDVADSPVSKEFAKILKRLGLYRRGLGFYALRHTFETITGEARDQVAVDHVMGHADQSMAAAYRERISDGRLRAVVEYVHRWLFGEATDTSPSEPKQADARA